jgi:hypothetical protein
VTLEVHREGDEWLVVDPETAEWGLGETEEAAYADFVENLDGLHRELCDLGRSRLGHHLAAVLDVLDTRVLATGSVAPCPPTRPS